MTTSPPLNFTLSAEVYHQIATDMFQRYADECYEGNFFGDL